MAVRRVKTSPIAKFGFQQLNTHNLLYQMEYILTSMSEMYSIFDVLPLWLARHDIESPEGVI